MPAGAPQQRSIALIEAACIALQIRLARVEAALLQQGISSDDAARMVGG